MGPWSTVKTIFDVPKNSFIACLDRELFKRSRNVIVYLPYFVMFQIVTCRQLGWIVFLCVGKKRSYN